MDTDRKVAVVHDGSTPGGHRLMKVADGVKKANNLSDVTRETARENLLQANAKLGNELSIGSGAKGFTIIRAHCSVRAKDLLSEDLSGRRAAELGAMGNDLEDEGPGAGLEHRSPNEEGTFQDHGTRYT